MEEWGPAMTAPTGQPMPTDAPEHLASQRPHAAARLEDRWRALVSRFQKWRGWVPRVEPFTGYGTTTSVRILGRVLLTDPQYLAMERRHPRADRRGWRYFFTAPAPGERVFLAIGGVTAVVHSDRSGYVDTRIAVALDPGWHDVTMTSDSGAVAVGRVLVVAPGRRLGVISDVDDTVMVTSVPRVFLAAWNTFVRHTSTRVPVAGMATLYRELAAPGTLFVYVSTGAWNTAATLRRFLERHGFPPGPLLLTDWGPTNTGWFRSGREHKETTIARLISEFEDVHWLLIGDDGQHDPEIYAHAARHYPEHIAAVAIRELTPTQQLLSHGTPVPTPGSHRVFGTVPTVRAPDGERLAQALATALRLG